MIGEPLDPDYEPERLALYDAQGNPINFSTATSIPPGGTAGQFLGKTSDTDYLVGWMDPFSDGSGDGGGGGAGFVTFDTPADLPAPADAGVMMAFIADAPPARQWLLCNGAEWWKIALSGTYSPDNVLAWSSNGDTNGLIYYLGTLDTAFTNPVGTEVGLTIQPGSASGHAEANAIGRNATSWQSNPPNLTVWFSLDLFIRRLIPDHFTMKSSSDMGSLYYPPAFRVEASEDATTWSTILDVPASGFTAQGQWKDWPITGFSTPYQYLRIVKVGTDNQGNHLMGFDEIEFYGTLSTE